VVILRYGKIKRKEVSLFSTEGEGKNRRGQRESGESYNKIK